MYMVLKQEKPERDDSERNKNFGSKGKLLLRLHFNIKNVHVLSGYHCKYSKHSKNFFDFEEEKNLFLADACAKNTSFFTCSLSPLLPLH